MQQIQVFHYEYVFDRKINMLWSSSKGGNRPSDLLLALVVKPFLSTVSPSQVGLRADLLVSRGVLERGFDPCIDDKNRRHRSDGKDV